MNQRCDKAAAVPAILVGDGLAILGNVAYRLDASLPAGESYALAGVRGVAHSVVHRPPKRLELHRRRPGNRACTIVKDEVHPGPTSPRRSVPRDASLLGGRYQTRSDDAVEDGPLLDFFASGWEIRERCKRPRVSPHESGEPSSA